MSMVTEAPATRSAFIPMATTASGERVIISVYPFEMRKEMRLAGHLPTLTLPAAPRDSYSRLVIGDSYQSIQDTNSVSEQNPTPRMRQAPVPAEIIATGLVADWGMSVCREGRPGIEMLPVTIKEETPEFTKWLAGLVRQQKDMAGWLLQDAADKMTNGDGKSITDLHRRMATWLLGDGSKKLPWFSQVEVDGYKACVMCAADIKINALRCPTCQGDLIEWCQKYDITTDAAVNAALARMGKVKNAQAPQPTTALNPDAETQPANGLFAKPVTTQQPKVASELFDEVFARMSGAQKTVYEGLVNKTQKNEYIARMAKQMGIE